MWVLVSDGSDINVWEQISSEPRGSVNTKLITHPKHQSEAEWEREDGLIRDVSSDIKCLRMSLQNKVCPRYCSRTRAPIRACRTHSWPLQCHYNHRCPSWYGNLLILIHPFASVLALGHTTSIWLPVLLFPPLSQGLLPTACLSVFRVCCPWKQCLLLLREDSAEEQWTGRLTNKLRLTQGWHPPELAYIFVLGVIISKCGPDPSCHFRSDA